MTFGYPEGYPAAVGLPTRAAKSPAGILVRKVRFAYRADRLPHWHPARPEWSQVVNAASLLMPYLEPFLIDAIREAAKQIRDPRLLEEAKGYMGQEAHHYKQHRVFNEQLFACGYPELRAHERRLEADYACFERERSLAFRLAYAAGFETMALAIGHMLIRMREWFFRDADPDVTSLVLWHFVEELEHKHAAFDVYQHVVGRWGLRAYGLLFAAGHTLRRTRQAYVMLLRRDGLWGRWRTRIRLKVLMFRIFGYLMPWLVESLTPWHRPSRFPDPVWAREWVQLYDAGEKRLVHLDTTRMHLSPAAMLAAEPIPS